MTDFEQLLSEFSDFHCSETKATVKNWLPRENIQQNISAFFKDQFEWLINPQFAASFQKTCPINGCIAEDYRNRILVIEQDKKLLTGIRFKSLDRTKPFVDVIPNHKIESETALTNTLKKIQVEFEKFQPIAIRLWVHEPEKLSYLQHPAIKKDLVLYAGKISEIREMEKPQNFDSISIKLSEQQTTYKKYESIHQEIEKNQPNLAKELSMLSPTDIQNSIKNELCYDVFFENNWVGVIIGKEDQVFALKGVVIQDELLHKDYRNKHLSSSLQRHFCEKINQYDFVFGTIHSKNTISQKTAESNGRQAVLNNYFVDLQFPHKSKAFETL